MVNWGDVTNVLFSVKLLKVVLPVMVCAAVPLKVNVPLPGVNVPVFDKFPARLTELVPPVNVPLLLKFPVMLVVLELAVNVPLFAKFPVTVIAVLVPAV